MSMPAVRVHTSQRDYDVLVGPGLLGDLGTLLLPLGSAGHVVLVSDENVAPLYAARVRDSLVRARQDVSEVVLPAGEQHKTLASAEGLYGTFYERLLRRTDVVVALGGGVIGDLAGFAAATYLRGVRLVQAPTTLLAMVDASVGGKVAVDFRAGKNHVGTFYQPWLVLSDSDTLTSLPERELCNGAAEVIKYGFLRAGRLLERVAAAVDAWAFDGELIADCVAAKADVVSRDEREEGGERQLLNLGHTIGHAVEAAAGFGGRPHGEAVGLGLRATLWLSERAAGLSAEEAARGNEMLSAARLPERLEETDVDRVIGLVRRDKKAGSGGVQFVLLSAFGRPVRGLTVPPELVEEVVSWLATR
jgi:3-dehydroquinate synthase